MEQGLEAHKDGREHVPADITIHEFTRITDEITLNSFIRDVSCSFVSCNFVDRSSYPHNHTRDFILSLFRQLAANCSIFEVRVVHIDVIPTGIL